ncbi:hypothetical protein HDU81_003333 [Chytriomyces hyalinus]|nr:hypothetical protein HDU81_003333 [Chytriomyces hyalinus]
MDQPCVPEKRAKPMDKITMPEETNSLISGPKDSFGTFTQDGQDVHEIQAIKVTTSNEHCELQGISDSQDPQLSDSCMQYSMRRTPSFTPSKIENGSFMTPKQILRAPIFWFFALVFVFIQGFTYNLNFIQILQATLQEPNAMSLADQNTRHVTIMSISQSLGRFLAPILLQRILSSYRPILLCLAPALILAPTIVLAQGVYSESLLYFASTCMQFGLGLALASHVVLTKDFFGAKYFATACAFSIASTPIGILGSNYVFGQLYDREVGTGAACLNANCYSKAFVVFSVFQGVALCFSLGVFCLRYRKSR